MPEEANLTTHSYTPLTWVIRLPQTKHTHTASFFSEFRIRPLISFLARWCPRRNPVVPSAKRGGALCEARNCPWRTFQNFENSKFEIPTKNSILLAVSPFFRTKIASPCCCRLCGCAGNNAKGIKLLFPQSRQKMRTGGRTTMTEQLSCMHAHCAGAGTHDNDDDEEQPS